MSLETRTARGARYRQALMLVGVKSAPGDDPAKRGGTAEGNPFRPQMDERDFLFALEVGMALSKHYRAAEEEPRLQAFWEKAGIYRYSRMPGQAVYSIDTPPPSVSGKLHLGHTYSYTHTDILARFHRMKGDAVFYPMGYDDNGLPTERFVERQTGQRAAEIGRRAFIELCLEVSHKIEKEYQQVWKRLGLSVDWRYTYRTIDSCSRKTSQFSFLDLYDKGLVYRQRVPTLWCPACSTAIAQTEVEDLERPSTLFTLAFHLRDEQVVPIATTRPELLPACVAIFVHPGDRRFTHLVGAEAHVPLFGHTVPILADQRAQPEKGTGAVMCCTFGDATDREWWYAYDLPLVEAIGLDGCLTSAAGEFSGMAIPNARLRIINALKDQHLVLENRPVQHTVPVHERCDTPVETIMSAQWFIRLRDHRAQLLAAGERVRWHPAHMQARYRSWVLNLSWDWCISRQRTFGVPFPLWYCVDCGDVMLAEVDQLPVDPQETAPLQACGCGSTAFVPEGDILDTWPTSSLTPQIAGQWLCGANGQEAGLYSQVFPFSLRPQAHEIIRSWAFYTIAKSWYHFGEIPWANIAISGWGLAGEGMAKISKSRGGGPLPPLEMFARYSADAVRYWAASTGPGKDAVISEEKIQVGARLVTKLWNSARFAEPFIADYTPASDDTLISGLPFTPADLWILSRCQRLIRRVTELLENYDYAAAKSELEVFFWTQFADNYLEMAKQRLYEAENATHVAARFTLYAILLRITQLFAPFLPFVTEAIYQGLFAQGDHENTGSVHLSLWPVPEPAFEDDQSERVGAALLAIATAARRYKSERNLPLGSPMQRLTVAVAEPDLVLPLHNARGDLASITRARIIEVRQEVESGDQTEPEKNWLKIDESIQIAIASEL